MQTPVRLILGLIFASAAVDVSAALVSVDSTAQLGPEGKIFWGDFGSGGSLVPAGSIATVKSLLDQATLDTATIGSGEPNYDGPFVVYNVTEPQSKGAFETGLNFTPGDRALDANWYDYSGITGRIGLQINKPWEFTFSQPVSGFGAQANATVFGAAALSIAAYDSSNDLLGKFSETVGGIHDNPNADGTAPFLGVLSNAPNISRIEFSVGGGNGEAMINSPYVRLAPATNLVTLLRGDFNRDGRVTNADLQAMLIALKDLNAYKQKYTLSDDDLSAIGDFDGNGVNAADIKPLINLVTGSNPLTPVPEPSTLLLAAVALGCLALRAKSR